MPTADKSDWRLQGQQKYLQGVILVHRHYWQSPRGADWDRDHCEFCSAKFMIQDLPDVLHVGYATQDDYRWICEQCFTDFKDMFEWQVVNEIG